MKRLFPIFFLFSTLVFGQNISQKLDVAVKDLMNSSPAFSSNISLYVSDEKGNLVYELNGNKGLSSASTQKIFTAACALETLGKNYQYTTSVSFSGTINNGNLNGDLHLFLYCYPTLGSWRYDGYKPENFKQK